MTPPDPPGRQQTSNSYPQVQDLSPSATTVAYDSVLPLLRVPVPAGIDDDLSKGPYVLAFKDETSWSHAWYNCERSIAAQCEAGARMGCSIRAVNSCRGPWWRNLQPFPKSTREKDKEREACEEKEMTACLAASREECAKFARSTCEPVFADLRIANVVDLTDPRFTETPRRVRITRTSLLKRPSNAHSHSLGTMPPMGYGVSNTVDQSVLECTNYRGRKILSRTTDKQPLVGPLWNNGSKTHMTSLNNAEPSYVGWEGGLVWPKRDPGKQSNISKSNMRNHDQGSPLQKIGFLWQNVLKDLKKKLMFMKF